MKHALLGAPRAEDLGDAVAREVERLARELLRRGGGR